MAHVGFQLGELSGTEHHHQHHRHHMISISDAIDWSIAVISSVSCHWFKGHSQTSLYSLCDVSDPQYHGAHHSAGVPRDSEERKTYPDRLHSEATGGWTSRHRVMKTKHITALRPFTYICIL